MQADQPKASGKDAAMARIAALRSRLAARPPEDKTAAEEAR